MLAMLIILFRNLGTTFLQWQLYKEERRLVEKLSFCLLFHSWKEIIHHAKSPDILSYNLSFRNATSFNISRHGRWFLRNVEEIMQKMRLTLRLFTALYLIFNRKGNLEISTNISVGIVFLQKNKRFFSVFRFTMLLISWMVDHKRNYHVKGIVRSKTKNITEYSFMQQQGKNLL